MNDTYYELETRLESRQERKTKEKTNTAEHSNRWIGISIVILLWLGVAAGAFFLANYYISDIQRQLSQIQTANQAQTEALNQRLLELQSALQSNVDQAEVLQQQFTAVESDLLAVKQELSLAGDSLSTTAESKQLLSERITELSKELAELRVSIKKLEEAARVY